MCVKFIDQVRSFTINADIEKFTKLVSSTSVGRFNRAVNNKIASRDTKQNEGAAIRTFTKINKSSYRR